MLALAYDDLHAAEELLSEDPRLVMGWRELSPISEAARQFKSKFLCLFFKYYHPLRGKEVQAFDAARKSAEEAASYAWIGYFAKVRSVHGAVYKRYSDTLAELRLDHHKEKRK